MARLSRGGGMSKYKVERLWGLQELLNKNHDLYSPLGNRMIVVKNGVLGGELLYSKSDDKVYGLCLKEVPTTDKDTKWLENEYNKHRAIKNMNYDDAKQLLKSKGLLERKK